MRTSNPLTCETCGDELTWVTHGAQTVQLCLRCAAKAGEKSSESTRRDSPESEQINRELSPAETLAFQLHGTLKSHAGPMPSAGAAVESTQIGRFVLKRILGRGSFGTVFHAYDPLLDREVALKVPHLVNGSHATLERFIREAKSAALLRHPNVVTVFECRHADGHPYIASEFVDGTTLSQLLNETPLVDLRLGVEWIRQIAEALHYAHTEGVIHRDIKPANIMISKSGRPQLMDFGLAKRITEEAAQMTVEGTIMGTPAFMSPEQARGEMSLVGPASDQYSIGVVLFTLLSGEMPYRGAAMSIVSRLRDHNDVAPKPRSIRPELPEDLEACCLKAMEKDPAARYANCQELAEDLKCWLEGRTLLARPIGLPERFVRWCHRNRMIAYLSGSLAGLLVAAMIAGFVLAFRFQDLARIANQEASNANSARLSETSARKDLERLLVDNYTENGLTAARRSDYRQAVLWFAQSAILAKQLPERRRHNLTRCASWLAQVAVPVYAFYAPGYYCKALRFHPSGRYLLVESLAWECEIQDLSTKSRLTLPVATPISEARWSPDGKLLAIASNNSLSLFDFPSLQPVRQWNHSGTISTIAFNTQGTRLAIGGDRGLQVYDVTNPKQASAMAEFGGRVQSIQFSGDGAFVAAATEDKHIRVYPLSAEGRFGDLAIPNQTVATEGTEVVFGFLAGRRLAIVDNNKAIRCWDLKQSTIAWERPIGRVICIDVSPDGKRLAFETQGDSYNHRAQVMEAATGQPWGGKVEHRNHIHSLDWHPDGKTLLAISSDHSASVTNMESGTAVVAMVPHNGFVLRGVCSPDGLTFATAHWHDRLVRVWRLPSAEIQDYLTPPENKQAFIKTTRDGLAGLLTGFDTRRTQRELQIHDTQSGKPIGSKIHSDGFINDAVYLPDQNLIVTGESVDAKSNFGSIEVPESVDGRRCSQRHFHFHRTDCDRL
jgi:serine/threonine protein kinase/WD40 repeat protein